MKLLGYEIKIVEKAIATWVGCSPDIKIVKRISIKKIKAV